jgi:WD40 repeat protein
VFTPKKAVFGNLGKWQNFYTSTFTGGDVAVVGTQKGQLYVFEGHRLTRVIPQAHKGKVTAVFCLREHNVLLSGGDDGVVRFWRADDMSALHSIRIESPVSGGPAAINSITTDVKSKALVGTKCGEIWEISDEARLLVEAHGKGELWGLAIHPSDPHKLATCSDDGTVRLWNITPGKGREVYARAWPRKEDAKKIENSAFDTGCVRSVAWHPDGNSLAVGTIAGKVHVYELYSYKGQYRLTCIKELDTRNEWISDLKYSPCTPDDPSGGRYLAVGSHENAVDIYDTKKPNAEYELAGTCRGHSSFITHLGWSKDGTTLYTNSGDYELLYWYAPKGVQIVNGVDVKDVTWADTTGVLGFETTGVWYRGSDGTDVNSADVTVVHGDHGYQERVLVTGDDRGIVSLFRAPALGGKPKTYGGHSSHVACVRFSRDGANVFTAGGGDGTVCQWEVIPEGRQVVPAGGDDAQTKQTIEHDAEDIGK